MRFEPKSADEIAESGLMPDGDYDFTVSGAEDAISKSSGNEMMVLDVKVFDGDGGSRTVRDYLVSSEKGIRKIRSFAVAVGMLAEYEAGQMDAPDLAGRSGRCKVKTDKSEGYEPKNAVAYYMDPAKQKTAGVAPVVRRAPAPAARAPVMAGADLDDEIPF